MNSSQTLTHGRHHSALVWLLVGALILCAVPIRSEEPPAPVELCALLKDPAHWDRKLIVVSGTAHYGFEEFTLSDPGCPSISRVWVELGGPVISGHSYCCGLAPDPRHPTKLAFEGYTIPWKDTPGARLLRTRMASLTERTSDTLEFRADVVGRFFAGTLEKRSWDGKSYWGGYGHMGCCTVIAVQEVRSLVPGP
jgi:hypothetical protein